MSNFYKIYPILTCKLILEKGYFTYLRYYGEKILFPVYAWLIEGGGKYILVDTGCSSEELENTWPPQKQWGGEEGPPIQDSLRKMGISMTEIETIILTHSHLDHFLNARKFPNAKVIVQEEELRYTMNPHPLFSQTYNRQWYEGVNFKTINGDTEIIPGIEVIFTPGHSPGGQSICVNTEAGKAVIVGFCSIDDNFGQGGDIVPGLHTDPLKAYDSIIKIRKIADIIIPSHSERVAGIKSIP